MFASVDIQLPQSEDVVVIPRTAISYAPYGNAVFVLKDAPQKGESDADSEKKPKAPTRSSRSDS